jgi:hypothetical protein
VTDARARAAAAALAAGLLVPGTASGRPLAVTAEVPASARVLDVAVAGRGRVVVLMDGALALFRRDRRQGLVHLDERPLAVSSAVRAPAGLLLADPGGDTCWVATNQAEPAILYSIEGDRLWEVQRATALHWPGSPRGATFRPGTNLVEVAIAGLGEGPFVRAGRGDPGWAIGNDGRLGIAGAGWTALRVGSAAAGLDGGTLVVSGPDPPGASDRLVLVDVSADGSTTAGAAVDVPGAVTALAAAGEAVIAAVVREGKARLLVLQPADAR